VQKSQLKPTLFTSIPQEEYPFVFFHKPQELAASDHNSPNDADDCDVVKGMNDPLDK
jgi:hypothetical protein